MFWVGFPGIPGSDLVLVPDPQGDFASDLVLVSGNPVPVQKMINYLITQTIDFPREKDPFSASTCDSESVDSVGIDKLKNNVAVGS